MLTAFPLSAATTPIPTLPFVGLLTPLDRPECGRVPGEAVSGASRQVRPISRARRGAVVANVGVDAGIAAEQHLPGSEPPLSRCEFPGVVIAGKDRPPAAFVHAIRRVGIGFVAGSIGTGPGWKMTLRDLPWAVIYRERTGIFPLPQIWSQFSGGTLSTWPPQLFLEHPPNVCKRRLNDARPQILRG